MPLPVVPDHRYVAATFQRAGADPVVNTFCFRDERSGPVLEDSADLIRDLLDSFYGSRSTQTSTIGDLLAPTLFDLRYVIYDLGQPNSGGLERASATWPTSAGSATSMLPPDCAITCSWSTALRGRSFRGRTYLGPLSQTTLSTDGTINASARTRVANAAALLIGDPLTRTHSLHILSRTKGITTPVTGGYVDNEYDTQRRRGYTAVTRTPVVAP